ncbi:hypothetical protein [Sphingomonas sp. IW22]|uniref:hypothetical protein n=1 Tax=Sphingomonas sp. IW22 TaxID=3242489 RepID=UPI00351F83E1
MMGDEVITAGRGRHIQLRVMEQGWTAARRKRFLDVLASASNVRLAAREVGVNPASAYALKRRDPAFAALWQEAIEQGYDRLEQALIEKARGQINEFPIEGGAVIVTGNGTDISNPAAMVDGRVEIDVKLAQWLLERQDRKRGKTGGRRPVQITREAVEAKILKKLDALARRRLTD